jgi:DNA-binding response OmpR family regulator
MKDNWPSDSAVCNGVCTTPEDYHARPSFSKRRSSHDLPGDVPGPPASCETQHALEIDGCRFVIIFHCTMRILVIEDETKVGCFVKRALEEESYAVDLCEDGAKGLEMALATNYDAIIVDLMLPTLSGLDIVKGIRRERIQTPILILTAQSQVDQRVKGLDAGADDYLTKPFAIDELLARVRALLRRGATDSPGILQIDDLVLNPATREVTRGGQRIDLTLKEYALLEYLMRHTGRVLTRPMISEHVWNQDFDTFTNVIDVYVNYLRNKVDRGRTKKLIHTIRGSGYMLKAD